ncbi:MAG: hypothetical protein AAF738_04810, partial [Bacteroidota bacterium]
GISAAAVAPIDTDLDGIPDYLDLDSDGDCCYDIDEAGLVDADCDGKLGTSDNIVVDDCGLVLDAQTCTLPATTNWTNSAVGCLAFEDKLIGCTTTPSGSISLEGMFSQRTENLSCGTFSSSPAGEMNDAILLYNTPGCYTITYTRTLPSNPACGVGSGAGLTSDCTYTEEGFLLVIEQPRPDFDIPNSVCVDPLAGVQMYMPTINSPTYESPAADLMRAWAISDNATNATVSVNSMTGQVTLTPTGGDVTGSYTLTLTETIAYTSCGDNTAGNCAEDFSVTVLLQNCAESCPIFTDFSADVPDICEGGQVDLLAIFFDRSVVQDPAHVIFSINDVAGNFNQNPYQAGATVTQVSTGAALLGADQSAISETGFTDLSGITVTGCEPLTYVLYAHLDPSLVDEPTDPYYECSSYALTTIQIWPDPSDITIDVVYEGCTAYFQPSCSDFEVSPPFIDLTSTTASTIDVTLSGGTGSPCTATMQTLNIAPLGALDAAFSMTQHFCEDSAEETGISLPAATITALTDYATATSTNVNDLVRWYGINVTDNGTTATFDPDLDDTPSTPSQGAYEVCVQIGPNACLQDYCTVVNVYETVEANIVAREICVSELPATIDLALMFNINNTSSTTEGGVFTITNNTGTGTELGNNLLFVETAGTFDITYSVSTDLVMDGCDDTDTETLTVTYRNPVWDAPSGFCIDAADPDLTTYFITDGLNLTTTGGTFDYQVNGTGGFVTTNLTGNVLDVSAFAAGDVVEVCYTLSDISASSLYCAEQVHCEFITINACDCPAQLLGTGSDICVNDPDVLIQLQAYTHTDNANAAAAYGVALQSNIATLAAGTLPAGFTDNADGTLSIDPSTTTAGTYVIGYFISDADSSCDGVVVYETIEIHPDFDPTFTLQTNVCSSTTNVALALDDVSAINAYVAATSESTDDLGDYIQWYGDGVTDAGDGTGVFDPSAAGVGVHTICADVGTATCLETYCQTIEVHQQVNPRDVEVILQDVHIECATNPSGNISLDALFTSTTVAGGIFASGVQFDSSLGTVEGNTLTYTGPGCFQIEYSVRAGFEDGIANCASEEIGTAFVYISEQPQPSFDATEEVCWDGNAGSITIQPTVTSPSYTATVNGAWSLGSSTTTTASTIDGASGLVTVNDAGVVEICYTETAVNPVCNGVADPVCVQTVCQLVTITETADAVDATWTSIGA